MTSAFVHKDAGHLLNNVEGFILWTGLFVFLNLNNPASLRHKFSKVFLATIFLAGFLTNVAEISIWYVNGEFNVLSRGASGITYAVVGVVLASAFVNFFKNVRGFRDSLSELKLEVLKPFLVGAMTISVAISILGRMIFIPTEFFSAAPNIDVFGHAAGFLIGFIGSFILSLIIRVRESDWDLFG